MDMIVDFLNQVSFIIGLFGCLILIYGVAISFFSWLKTERMVLVGKPPKSQRSALRHQLSYYLLLSLEFLIAADVIKTIVHPSLQELAILGGVLAIRTVISLSLTWELKSKSS